jgi:hypothetical protein
VKKKKSLSRIFGFRCVILPMILFFIMCVVGGYFFFVIPIKNPAFHQDFILLFSATGFYIFLIILGIIAAVMVIGMIIHGRLEVYEAKLNKNNQEIKKLQFELNELSSFDRNNKLLKSKMMTKRTKIDSAHRRLPKKTWIYRFIAKKFGYVEEWGELL